MHARGTNHITYDGYKAYQDLKMTEQLQARARLHGGAPAGLPSGGQHSYQGAKSPGGPSSGAHYQRAKSPGGYDSYAPGKVSADSFRNGHNDRRPYEATAEQSPAMGGNARRRNQTTAPRGHQSSTYGHYQPDTEVLLDPRGARELPSLRDWAAKLDAYPELRALRQKYGSYEWIGTDNSPTARHERRQVAAASLKYSQQNFDRSIEDFDVVRASELLLRDGRPIHSRSIQELRGQTVVQCAIECARSGRRVALVSAASADQFGGGFFRGGRHALEEAIFVLTTLPFSLHKACSGWYGRTNDKYIPDDGAILSPNVYAFRAGTEMGYAPLPGHVRLSVISVAMPNRSCQVRGTPFDFYRKEELNDVIAKKWQAVVWASHKAGADTLVIPDAGCGVYGNDPQQVGHALGRALLESPFAADTKVMLGGKPEFTQAVREVVRRGDVYGMD